MMPGELNRRAFLVGAGATAATAAMRTDAEAERLTLALVGTHHVHIGGYADRLHTAENVTVKYVWDPDPKRAEEFGKRMGATVAKTPEEVWADKAVVGAAICSETVHHRRLVLGAAKAGKHLFVEKPMGVTGRECREMADAIEKAGVLFTTGYGMRTSGQNLYLKELVDKGAFGKVTRARACVCHNAALGGWFDGEWRWMADPKQSGGGGLLDLGTHGLDLLMWFFGDVERATGDVKNVTNRYPNCDDTGEGLMRFRSGVTASLVAGWVDIANPVSLEIHGTEGHAVVFNGLLYLSGCKGLNANGQEAWSKLPPGLPSPLDQWLEAVGGKQAVPLVTAREAAARVSVMEAIYRGSAERKWVTPL